MTSPRHPTLDKRFFETALCRAARGMPHWRDLNARSLYWMGRYLDRFPGASTSRVASLGGKARLLVDLHDPDGKRTYVSGCYEPQVTTFATHILREGDLVLDVGANIGAHALLFGALVGGAGHVHAFEPHPPAAALLRSSIALNGWGDRLTVHQAALSDAEGTANFQLSGALGNMSSLIELPWCNDALVTQIQTRTLDALVDDLRAPRLMKVDVEGAECLVLAGGKRRFFPEIPPEYLIVEFWSYGDPAALFDIVCDLGYRPIRSGYGLSESDLIAPRCMADPFEDGFEFRNLFFEAFSKR